MKTPLRFYSILNRSVVANFSSSSHSNQVAIDSKSFLKSTILGIVLIALSNFKLRIDYAYAMHQNHYNINNRVIKADLLRVLNSADRPHRLAKSQGYFSVRISKISPKWIYDL